MCHWRRCTLTLLRVSWVNPSLLRCFVSLFDTSAWPQELYNLRKLKVLTFEGNELLKELPNPSSLPPLTTMKVTRRVNYRIPAEVSAGGGKAIINYLRDFRSLSERMSQKLVVSFDPKAHWSPDSPGWMSFIMLWDSYNFAHAWLTDAQNVTLGSQFLHGGYKCYSSSLSVNIAVRRTWTESTLASLCSTIVTCVARISASRNWVLKSCLSLTWLFLPLKVQLGSLFQHATYHIFCSVLRMFWLYINCGS